MFYLLSVGGTHPITGITVSPIGIQKAIQIAVKANSPSFWPSNGSFRAYRDGMVVAAENLFGVGSAEANAVRSAWEAVGVVGPSPPR